MRTDTLRLLGRALQGIPCLRPVPQCRLLRLESEAIRENVRLPGRIRTCDLQIRSLKCYPLHHEEIVRGKLIRADGIVAAFLRAVLPSHIDYSTSSA